LSDCPVPVKTHVGQVDLVLRLSDGTSEKIRDSQTCRYNEQIYFHWYKILGLLYKRALFDLQFVHNLFWLKLKWNARSKLFYCIILRSSIWSSRTLTKLKSQSQKRFKGILSTKIVIFSYPKLLSFSVLTFIKWRLTMSYAAKDTIFWQKRPKTIAIRIIVLDDNIQIYSYGLLCEHILSMHTV
jgi:hypothetical protein